MKKLFIAAISFAAIGLAACGEKNDRNDAVLKDPAVTETMPDSTKIVADSVIVPDTVPNNGRQVGASDSLHHNR